MAMLTVRNLPDEVHRALRVRAAQHGHSTEAEVREILANAVKPETRVRLGEALAALGRQIGLTNKDFEVVDRVSDKAPAEPLSFEPRNRSWTRPMVRLIADLPRSNDAAGRGLQGGATKAGA